MKLPWLEILLALGATAVVGGGAYVASGGEGMNGTQVPSTRTPVSAQQMSDALQNAWPSIVGGNPSRESILVLLSQWSLETGGGASMIQYNVGNFKATANTPLYTTFMTTEVVNGVTEHLPQNFAAYPDLASGVSAYLSAMVGRFGAAWQYVLAGDVSGFAQALKDQGYYTADEATYAAGLQARYSQLETQIA